MKMEHKIETSHCTIAIEESTGTGSPLLLIHGNSSCKEVFKNQMQGGIGATFHCIAMDLPGHGDSSNANNPDQTYTMSGYADVALEVMDKLGIKSFAVLGWSLGGHIGIEMLSRSDRLAGLLISGTPPISKDPGDMANAFLPSEHMNFTGQETLSRAEADRYAHATCGSDAAYEDFLGDAVRRTDGRARRIMMEAVMRGDGADQRQIVEHDPTPLAIVNGAEESIVNNVYLKLINYQNLWEGKVHLIPGMGHAPFWESPAEFDQLLMRFVTGLDSE
jgi:pimeloyl-ACP methyl ester carboxylesterase